MNQLGQIISQFFSLFKKMTPTQVISILLVFISTIVVIISLIMWMSQPDYAVLFGNLEMNDAAAITQKLQEMGIPFKMRGSAVMVPSKYVYDARLQLAADGLPQGGGVGYEIFDKKSSLGMTDYLQQVNYKRALEGELSRTIASISGVKYARVHLVLPKKAIFTEEQVPPSASVLLGTNGLTQLSRQQIKGIVHLVASSVEGMMPDNITIVDSLGNMLSSPSESPLGGVMNNSQIDLKQRVERYLEEKANSMLAGVLGPGKAIVRVNADLDFTSIQKTEERFDPETAVPRSEESSSEKGAGEAGGVKSHTITNYEISKTVSHIIESPGQIKSLSVSVVIGGRYEGEGDKREYVPRTDEEKQKIREIVANAVGLSEERGDKLAVTDMPFDDSYQKTIESEAKKEGIIAMAMQGGKTVGLIVLLIIALLFVQGAIKTISQSIPKPTVEIVQQTPAAKAKPESEEQLGAQQIETAADIVRDYLNPEGEA